MDVGNAATVAMSCGDGATCAAGQVLSNTVSFICDGAGQCEAHCGLAESCSMSCIGTGTCVLKCDDATACNITQCDANGACFLLHPNVATTAALSCDGEATNECGADLFACHAPCP
jgi:hypothetical protein